MAATGRTLRLEQQLVDAIAAITDQQVRDMVTAWATAWDTVAPDLTAVLLDMLTAGDRVTSSQLMRSKRLQKVLVLIADELDDLVKQAGVIATGSLRDVIDTAGAAQASIIDSQLPARSPKLVNLDAWSRVDPRQISAIVRRSTQQITSLNRPLSAQAYGAVRRELIRGVAAGSNPRVTARRIVARAEQKFNGGLARALTIARTETLDAHRAAAQVGQAQHTDVLQGWQWLASLGPRTCPACWGMNGTIHAVDDPGPLGHQNCRCSRIPVTKSWAELGIKGVQEPKSLVPDTQAAFRAMSKPEQVAVLGPKGWTAWNAGEFPSSKWATRRKSEGWRDSYVPAKPPEVVGGNGAGRGTRGPAAPASTPDPGRVTRPEGLKLRQHELDTGNRLASLGLDVDFLPNPDDVKSVDVFVIGKEWEMKSPLGNSPDTVIRNPRNAQAKARRVILDLQRTPMSVDEATKQIRDFWRRRPGNPIESVWVLPHDVRNHFTLER